MTKPINLYLQSRISNEISFNRVERHSSGKNEICKTHNHEINSLKIMIDELINYGCSLEMFDGFFYGYNIPQIGKEFDLLKFTDTECINIELKSQAVPAEQILAQLSQESFLRSIKH